MLLIHIITGLLVTVALLSLQNNFGNSLIFIAPTFLGLTISWWQQKKNKSIPYLKIILNIIFIALTIKALLPFFIKKPSDILGSLIKTWIYFLILSTFTIQSKREYYLIQVLSLGLITFSCFDQTTPPIILLSYILLFFIIWIIALRGISLSKDIKEIKEVLRPQKWLYRELKVGIVFLLLLIFLVIPIYLFIPHFNISVPFLPRFVEQKYAITYADFPRNRMLSFLSRSPEKLANKEKISASKRGEKSELGLIEFPKVKKQVFWHSPQEYKNNLQELERKIEEIQTEITKIDKELQEISQEEKIPEVKESIEERKRLTERYKALAKNREQLQEQQAHLKEEYLKAIQEKSVASINEPENKELLKSLEEKIKTKESNLENITKNLKTLKEELNRISETIDEVRATVYRQSMKSDKGSQIQKAWAKKEALEQRLESLKEEIQTIQKEYEQYIQLVKEKKIEPLEQYSPQEYENMLKDLERKIEEIQTEITKIDKELQEISQEEKISQVKESIEERKRLTERYKALAKNREQLQEQQAHLKEEYLKTTQEKSVASINEPENKELLKSLEEKIKTEESNLENITKNLKTLKEELNRISETIDEVRATVYRQSMKSDKGSQIQKAWAKKENLEERLETLKEEIQTVQKEYNRIIDELTAQKTQEELEKKEEKKEEFSLFDLLIRILILVIFSILLFLIYCVIAFFFPYLREKNKFKKTSRQLKYKLAMVLLYNFLCRILNIFGYRYPVIIDPEEYSVKVIRDFKNLRSDVNLITTLFLEARYSTHTIIKEQVETALNSYKNILKELKNTGSFWRKIILRLDFVFKL